MTDRDDLIRLAEACERLAEAEATRQNAWRSLPKSERQLIAEVISDFGVDREGVFRSRAAALRRQAGVEE